MYSNRITHVIVMGAVVSAVLCQHASGQEASNQNIPNKDAQIREAKGMPPRATSADYQSHAQAGDVTIAAEFTGHSVATPEAVFSTEDYVVVEVALFGPPDARLKLSSGDFSLRINNSIRGKGQKTPLPVQPYALVFKSLKDPEWEPPTKAEPKSKTNIGGGGGGQGDPPPAPVHMPFELVRTMEQRVQKAALPEGERVLPVAGLIFFSYRGKTDGLRSIELLYTGPAGKASMDLHP